MQYYYSEKKTKNKKLEYTQKKKLSPQKNEKQKIGVHPKKIIYCFYKIWVIIDIFITIKWCSSIIIKIKIRYLLIFKCNIIIQSVNVLFF